MTVDLPPTILAISVHLLPYLLWPCNNSASSCMSKCRSIKVGYKGTCPCSRKHFTELFGVCITVCLPLESRPRSSSALHPESFSISFDTADQSCHRTFLVWQHNDVLQATRQLSQELRVFYLLALLGFDDYS